MHDLRELPVLNSRDLFFKKVSVCDKKRVRHRDVTKILSSLYDLMQQISTENPPIFAAPDLNNIPVIDLSNIDGVSLVHNQNLVNDKIVQFSKIHEQMREHLFQIQTALCSKDKAEGKSTAECKEDEEVMELPIRDYASALKTGA